MSDKQKAMIREVFLRNGFRIKPGADDLADYVYEAARELLQVATGAQGEPSLVVWVLYDTTADKKYIKACNDGALAIFDNEAAARRARTMHQGTDYKRCEYYTAPQPAEQQPDVAQLVEALERAHMALIGYLPSHRNDITDAAISHCEQALAAYRKQWGEV